MRCGARCFLLLALVLLGATPAAAGQDLFSGFPHIGERDSVDSARLAFVILGDKTSGGEGNWPIYDRAVDAINLLRPEFVITVGDQIPGHMQDRAQWDAEWKEYREHARRLVPPCLFIPGNHDIANVECYRFWKEDLGPTHYSFDYKGCHFLVLNTEEDRLDGRGPVWQTMMAFAEKDLAAHADARHTFVFFHKPMWDDPRFEEDWARLSKALQGRKYTAVAGHEHYQMAEYQDGNLLMIQSATGAGVSQSRVKAFGGFRSFGYVTVEGDTATYAVVEPDGGIWPAEIAPASFRKAVSYELVRLDAERVEDAAGDQATVRARVALHNTLGKEIEIEVSVKAMDACGWQATAADNDGVDIANGKLVFSQALRADEHAERRLTFRVPRQRLAYPPGVSWRVKYEGEWIQNEAYPMVQENVIPIGPAACMKTIPEWQLVGPFPLGDIDARLLPDKPAEANANFFRRFGPEDGYDAAKTYEGGLKWYPAQSVGRGLLNFNALMGTLDHALGYALCGVYSPVDQTVHATIGADNYAQVVLNGTLVEEGRNFGAPGGFTHVPLALKTGWNTLTVKLINNRGDWFLRVLVADPMGNLRFAQRPEGK